MPPAGYEPFLETILDNPADDGPRLVYADWLEEQGDPRAEFIRDQLQLARLTPDDAAFADLTDRISELLLAHGEEWRAEIPEWARKNCEFRRGFVSDVTLFTPWERRFGAELSRAAPVEKLTLQQTAGSMAEFAAHPGVRHLHELELVDAQMDVWDLKFLCDSAAAVGSLTSLTLFGIDLLDAGPRLLSLCKHLGQLTRLELIRCRIGAPGLRELAAAQSLPRLAWLDLSDNDRGSTQGSEPDDDRGHGLGNDALWHLARSPLMKHITRLYWNSNGLTGDAIQILADCAQAGQLTHLEVARNHIGDAGIRLLLEKFPHLQFLNVSQNPFTTGMALLLKEHFGNRVRTGLSGERGSL
jgi:uncharacterized protein (TIGR02996 family)